MAGPAPRRRLTPRARWGLVVGVVLALAAAGGIAAAAWRDLRPVRTDLVAARQTLQQAIDDPAAIRTPEERSATLARIDGAVRTIEAARHRLDRSRPFSFARFIPLVAHQRDGVLDLLDDAREGAAAGRKLVAEVQGQQDRTQLQEGRVPFEGLAHLATEARAAAHRVRKLVRSASGLWGSLGDARRRFNAVAGTSSTRLLQGADALEVARTFMGASADRRHLIALQNNAEMRDQGMMLSYAVASFAGGRLTFERTGTVGNLLLDRPVPTPVPAGTQEVFGSIRPSQLWQSVNATADFAWSARVMADMYRQATGEPVDGVIAIDVPGLAALLRVVGPVQVAGIAEPLSADNVARILLHDQYAGLAPTDDQGPRRERLGDLTRGVIERLTVGSRDTVGLGRELGESSAGGHFRLWSPRADEEGVFERTGLGGGPATVDPGRTFHLAVENRTATKLDYYVQPMVRQELRFSGRNDVFVRTRVQIDNQAPPGPPSYQLGPDEFTARPGDYSAWVLLWGPDGAQQPGGTAESGLTLSQWIDTVGPGERREVVFDTLIPNAVRDGRLTLRLVPQSRLRPIDLTVTLDPAGRKVRGPTSWHGPWDRTRTLTWEVRS
jgi:hypothetical protein